MFQAFWLAVVLSLLSVGRWVAPHVVNARKEVLLAVEYAALYFALLMQLIWDLLLVRSHLPRLRWLDPDFLEWHAKGRAEMMNLTQDELHQMLAETTLRPYPSIRWISIFTPVAVILIWPICVWGTYRQARAIWRSRTDDGNSKAKLTPSQCARDLAVQIIALPMVYALMSLAAVCRMWQVVGHDFGDTVKTFTLQGKEQYVFEVFEADYHMGDLYEAWALYHFSNLVMSVIRKKFDTVRSHRVFGGGAELAPSEETLNEESIGSPSMKPHKVDIEKERRSLEDALHTSVQRLTMQGVLSFVVCCTLQSIYGLGLPLLVWCGRLMTPKMWASVEHNQLRVHDFFLGMGSIASTAAISNIVQVEHIFHEQLLEFRPFWKFWGTKVLVSLAFLQMLIFRLPVPPFRDMSQVHTHLIYASMLCYECLAVGLLHMYAWHADEAWYDLADVRRPGLPFPLKLRRRSNSDRRSAVQASRLGKSNPDAEDEERPLEGEMY